MMYTLNRPTTEDTSNCVCMEVAGIESCGLGYSAPSIPVKNSEEDGGD